MKAHEHSSAFIAAVVCFGVVARRAAAAGTLLPLKGLPRERLLGEPDGAEAGEFPLLGVDIFGNLGHDRLGHETLGVGHPEIEIAGEDPDIETHGELLDGTVFDPCQCWLSAEDFRKSEVAAEVLEQLDVVDRFLEGPRPDTVLASLDEDFEDLRKSSLPDVFEGLRDPWLSAKPLLSPQPISACNCIKS